MKKISLKDIPEDEILSAKDLRSILGDESGSGSRRGSGSRGSGSKGSGMLPGSGPSNCAPSPPLYICGDNCRTATGAASKCAINSKNQCTCGGL